MFYKKPTGYAFLLMKKLKMLGVKFLPEYFDGHKHIDIFIPKSKMAIEIDGTQHVTSSEQILKDFQREKFSQEKGISTIHISNKEIKENSGGVASAISEASAILYGNEQK